MKITLNNPMDALKLAKKDAVNTSFNTFASLNLHTDLAYSQKREWAKTQDERLKSEADLRGVTVEVLSAMILSKPDIRATREYRRQMVMIQIDQAQTPKDLDAVIGKAV